MNDKERIKILGAFLKSLKNVELPHSYYGRYITLYIHLEGSKQRISYTSLVSIWNVEVSTARGIMGILSKYYTIKKTQENDHGNSSNNRGYLFVEPLIHPFPQDT